MRVSAFLAGSLKLSLADRALLSIDTPVPSGNSGPFLDRNLHKYKLYNK